VTSQSPTTKKKRKGGGADKETKEAINKMETKIEDVRK